MAADKKKNKFSLRKLIYNDKYLIIISIVLAVCIWCATSMNLSPETTKTITVPVTVDFSDSAASQLGIKCYGDEKIDVDVTISCKKYLAKDISANNLDVYLQTNAVTSKGNYDVPVKVEAANTADFKIVSYYPTVYRAYFDVEEEKVMDINIEYATDDFIEDGYVMGEALLSESSVTVKGPKSYVSQVDKIVSNISFDSKIKSTQTVNAQISAIDSEGSAVDYISFVTKNDNLTLTIPVLKKTTLDVTSSFTGKPTGLDVSDFNVKYSVNSVNAGVLEEADIQQANIGNIDFSQLTVGDNEFKFSTNNMESFTVLDNIEEITAVVTVPSSYTTTSLYVDGNNVEITNIPQGYKAEVVSLSSYNVTAVGREDALESLNSSNVKLMVDLSGMNSDVSEGIVSYNLTAALDNNDTCWIYGSYTAQIRIYK